MSASVQEPSPDELLAMAYVDGELDEAARKSFEVRLATREDLRREVVELQKLGILARSMAAPEPIDLEWQRLKGEPLQSTSTILAFVAMAVGATGLAGWAGWSIWKSDLSATPKYLLAALCGGALTLFLVTLRGRLRTLPFDPYTEIER
jgi:anti-sigma factor RsiW